MVFIDIGGIVINILHLVSFKITHKGKVFYLKLYMDDASGFNIAYENIEHLYADVKKIEQASSELDNKNNNI